MTEHVTRVTAFPAFKSWQFPFASGVNYYIYIYLTYPLSWECYIWIGNSSNFCQSMRSLYLANICTFQSQRYQGLVTQRKALNAPEKIHGMALMYAKISLKYPKDLSLGEMGLDSSLQ